MVGIEITKILDQNPENCLAEAFGLSAPWKVGFEL